LRACDIAVVGLGLIGAAALRALTARGADVLGFDPLGVGEPRGSSHGSCRVFRRFNFENPTYTALSERAHAGWRSLEAESGTTILMPCPVLEAGPAGSVLVEGSRAAAGGQGAGPTNGAEANAVYPAFRLPDDWEVMVQEDGGILLAEAALRALRAPVADRIVARAAQIEPTAAGIRVVTAEEEMIAGQVVVAAGPWIGGLVPALAPLFKLTRQAVGWFSPARPEAARYGALPIFLLDTPEGLIYGFPDFEGRGVKAAAHDHGRIVGPDDWTPPPTDAELAPTRAGLETFAPGAAGPILEREICLYTNTIAADLRPDGGEEFIIDRLPADPRVVVVSACSGHGAKFAPAIGDMVADLALDAGYRADPAFRLDRFSQLARAGMV
jgi:sarcosine oxidase